MIVLEPEQEKAVESLSNGNVLHGGVGTGKTITALEYYRRKESPKPIYVITTARKRDRLEWDKEAALMGISTRQSCSGEHGKMTVDSWNNVGKYVDVQDAFFIFDEQRVVGTGAWVKAFLKIAKSNNWILLSATPGDTWSDYAPLFIANGLYKNITQFRNEHVVYAPRVKYPMIIRYLDVPTLEAYRNMLLVEMPVKKHTTRHIEYVTCDYDRDLLRRAQHERWHVFEDRPIYDAGEMIRVMRKIVSLAQERVDKYHELLDKHPKLIVFYNFDYELELLRKTGRGRPIGEWNGHKKTEIPDSEEWLYLVQYTSGAEGWNCTETDAMTFWSMSYSWKITEQSMGRIDRMNTSFSDLYYYFLTSATGFDRAIRKSLKEKKVFNENRFMKSTSYFV